MLNRQFRSRNEREYGTQSHTQWMFTSNNHAQRSLQKQPNTKKLKFNFVPFQVLVE